MSFQWGDDSAASLARAGVLQVLTAALGLPGELDHHTAENLVRDALTLHAWAVREAYCATLKAVLEQKPLSIHDINGLRQVAAEERATAALALSKHAYFIATTTGLEVPGRRQ